MKHRIQRLYKGFASIRSPIIDKCLKEGKNLVIEYNGQQMTLPPSRLKNSLQLNKRTYISKYNNEPYSLLDYCWEPDKELF